MFSTLRNAGAVTRKSRATATAPMRAPTAGIPNRVDRADRVLTRSSWVAVVVTVAISGHLVPFAANCSTCAMLLESMKAGPVATGLPPPITLPLVL